jgi:hypothetical protein
MWLWQAQHNLLYCREKLKALSLLLSGQLLQEH